jgi:hypothetical protein
VVLDPTKEVVTLIGSKEGIAHIPLAFINPGDTALVTSPGYPVYDIGVKFAGGQTYFMDLLKENDFLPDLEAVPKDVVKKAKMMFINYQQWQTGSFLKRLSPLHRLITLLYATMPLIRNWLLTGTVLRVSLKQMGQGMLV